MRAADLAPRLGELGYAAGWSLVKGMPEPIAERSFCAMADTMYRRDGAAVTQLRANLRRVLGAAVTARDLEDVVLAGIRSYLRYWCEVFRLPVLRGERMDDRFAVEGLEGVTEAQDQGRGVVLVLPHMGNWDLAGAWFVHHGYPFTTVAERLRPESLFDRFVAFRQSLGMEVLPLTGGHPPFGVLARRLRAGGTLCLLGDRDLSRQGVPVTFFGEPTRMPAGPAALAVRTGAALHPVTLWNDPHVPRLGHGLVGAELTPGPDCADPVADLTQQLADAFALGIARHPQDWHMLQPLWLADLSEQRRARLAEADDAAPPEVAR